MASSDKNNELLSPHRSAEQSSPKFEPSGASGVDAKLGGHGAKDPGH